MSYDCVCDYDPPEFYRQAFPRARKNHKCCECGGYILPGERYEYVFGKWEGEVDKFKTCERCFDIWQWTKNNVPCLCWAHGHRIEDCRAAIEEAWDRASEETRGLRFGFLRRVTARNKFNLGRKQA